ncbi:MAG: LLM class flavin-dependent oxidoreductase [Thermomicrobiales bacterium]
MTVSVTHDAPGLMLSDELELRELIHLVELAEAVGYSELWYTDQRFWRDCYMGLTVAAQHSQRLRLGPGVNDPFTRHPAGIAMAIATLDELSEGRAQLGLGVGGSGLAQMRLPKEKPVRALREAIELIRAMLTGEVVQYDGELFHLDSGKLGFLPVRSSIPISVASHSPQVLRLCGRSADGVLLGNMANRAAIDEATQLIRDAEQSAHRPAGSVAINLRLEACIAEDEGTALVAMKRRFAARLIASYPQWEYLERLGVSPSPMLRSAAEAKAIDRVVATLMDADVRTTALVGSAAAVATQLGALLTPDIARVTIRPYSCAGQGFAATVEAFMTQVWPAISRPTHERFTSPV